MKSHLLLAMIGIFVVMVGAQKQEGNIIYQLFNGLSSFDFGYHSSQVFLLCFEQDSSVWIADYLLMNLLTMIRLMD